MPHPNGYHKCIEQPTNNEESSSDDVEYSHDYATRVVKIDSMGTKEPTEEPQQVRNDVRLTKPWQFNTLDGIDGNEGTFFPGTTASTGRGLDHLKCV